ncbi:acyltransferase [Chryseobacterium sp. Alg-005]
MRTLPNITSLRFFLALLVMIFHIPQFFKNRGLPAYNELPVFNKGSEAVFMFFSLSGFLIIRQLFEEKTDSGSINLKNFYMRRILRIFPLYYLVAIVGLLYYNVLLPKIGFDFAINYNLWEGAVLLFTFFPNIFATYSPGGILEILWSIGVEEQFYLLIAPLILLMPQKNIRIFLLLFSFLFIGVYYFPEFDFFRKYNMMFFYFSFAGWCSLIAGRGFMFPGIIRSISYILLLVYFTTDFFTNMMEGLPYHLFSMVLFGVFLISFTQKQISFFENKKLIYLGKISYGIYMYHAIVMQPMGFIFLKLTAQYNISVPIVIVSSFLLIILITVFISHLSYKYYEKKFLTLKSKFRPASQ